MNVKRIILSVLCWALVSLGMAQVAESLPYVIERFDVTLTVDRGAAIQVEERIQVLFHQERRGIFRKIPTEYETRTGARRLFLSRITVTDGQGQSLTTDVSREGRYARIRIGDEDVFLPAGTRKTYVIRYRAENGLNWFDEDREWEPHVELYWNATGTEWDTVIQQSSVLVEFPEIPQGGLVRARAFAGPHGDEDFDEVRGVGASVPGERTGVSLRLESNRLLAERALPLNPYEGVTVVINLPVEVVPPISGARALWFFLVPNLGVFIPLVALLGCFLAWFRYGREPKVPAVEVAFEPPEGLTPALCGTLIDESVDQRDLSAAIVSLAVKGYLTIHPSTEGTLFPQKAATLALTGKTDGKDLGPVEVKLLKYLRECEQPITSSELRDNVAVHLADLHQAAYEGLIKRGLYRHNPQNAKVGFAVVGIMGVIGLTILLGPLLGYGELTLVTFFGGLAGVVVVLFASKGMSRRTESGAKAFAQLKGFETFMRGRKHYMAWVADKHPDGVMYETYLPYAVALGLVKEWSTKFEGVVTEPPRWYAADPGTTFLLASFASDFNFVSHSIGASAATPPRTSAAGAGGSGFSGGGGFSGRGFGGGGGGSW